MARFGGRTGRDGGGEREGRSGGRSAYRGGRGRSGGGFGGGRSSSKKNDSGFVGVGSLTTKKGTSDRVVDELRDSKIGLWWKVYLPEGVKTITLRRDQRVFVQLGSFPKNAPDFVVGSVSLPPEEDDNGGNEGRRSSRRDDDDQDDQD